MLCNCQCYTKTLDQLKPIQMWRVSLVLVSAESWKPLWDSSSSWRRSLILSSVFSLARSNMEAEEMDTGKWHHRPVTLRLLSFRGASWESFWTTEILDVILWRSDVLVLTLHENLIRRKKSLVPSVSVGVPLRTRLWPCSCESVSTPTSVSHWRTN